MDCWWVWTRRSDFLPYCCCGNYSKKTYDRDIRDSISIWSCHLLWCAHTFTLYEYVKQTASPPPGLRSADSGRSQIDLLYDEWSWLGGWSCFMQWVLSAASSHVFFSSSKHRSHSTQYDETVSITTQRNVQHNVILRKLWLTSRFIA